MLFLAFDPRANIEFGDALGIALTCMVIVFAILVIIWLLVYLFQFIKIGTKTKTDTDNIDDSVEEEEPAKPVIKDDNMLAAVLAATIDYTNETKKDVKVVSVKELK